ncbi:MAG TPA: NAD(P)H-hydrate epimerase, partial [Caldimonas sp.]|nr:NAD(P)H-hydrate epimerase [Caldimonas sp.]
RAFDAHAVERCHVPSLVLMENAGRGSTDVLMRELLRGGAKGARVVAVCGTGNNGGDGLVMARHLALRDAAPVVFLVGDAQRVSPDARANLDAWRGIGGEVRELPSGGDLSSLVDAMARADVVVDALFGTGLDRPVEGFLAGIVRALNASPGPRFSVDLPSGLDADTGVALGVAVEARVTATFAHHKVGLLTPRGAQLAGRVHVVDIGVPASIVERVGVSAHLLEASDVARWLPTRARGAHKNSAGHVVVIGGSAGKIGAPQLVARGAMRAGAGLATIATWPDAIAAIESHVLEAMTARIDPSRPLESVDALLAGKHAVVAGPGFGLGGEARALVEHILASYA